MWSVGKAFTDATYTDHSKRVGKGFTDRLKDSKGASSDQQKVAKRQPWCSVMTHGD
jgi:hypothetical protein